MNAFGTRSGILLTWLAALGAVAALIGWETDWGRGLTPAPVVPDVAAPPPVTLALLPDYRVEDGGESRQQTLERPVFVPTRRPAPPPVPTGQEAAKPRMQKGQFVLTGTAVVDQKSIAFLRESTGGKSRSVRVGETINGLLVAEVKPDRVKLTMGEDSEELVLKVAAGPRTTTQPAPPPVPGAPTAGRAAGPASAVKPTDDAGPTAVAPGQAATAPAAAGNAETSLLERRRAARAAQAAAEAAARAGQAEAPSAPAPATQAAPPAADAGWSDVYRRMQQPRR